MSPRLLGRMLAAAAVIPLAIATAAPPASAATSGWRVTQTVAGSFALDRVTATSAGNAWVTGESCGNPCGPTSLLAAHWAGTGWQAIAPPSGFSTSVGSTVTAASSPSSAWVFANQGSNVDTTIALRWNGTAWTGRHDFPAWSDMNAAVVIGKADAWAFGQIISPFAPYVAHYNGTIGESLPHPNPSGTSQGVILKYGP